MHRREGSRTRVGGEIKVLGVWVEAKGTEVKAGYLGQLISQP